MSLEIVVFVGLPAAGKTTFYRQRFGATHVHVSKDNFRSARYPGRRQRREIAEALTAGKSVVVDNTNPSLEERAAILEVALEFGATAVAYTFELTCEESIERNADRSGSDHVPNVGVYATAKRLTWPTLDEGFTEITRVRGRDGIFEIVQTVSK
jgi:predicted kinase